MYSEPLFLKPIFKDRIWGGTALQEKFHYDIPSETTGECWAISGHKNGPSIIKNGPLAGKSLQYAWDQHRELFGHEQGEQFPLLVKILDANTDLSVQVHPNDDYALIHEQGELGKTECWYVIDCDEGAELILGHYAKTKEELSSLIEEGQWEQLLKKVSIQPGDFFYVPSGTVHAIGKGTLILETQQSSDTTYRVYDYDRIDENGQKRELHIKESIQVMSVPHEDFNVKPITRQNEGLLEKKLVGETYFTVFHGALHGEVEKETNGKFLLFSCISGDGEIKVDNKLFPFNKGSHFIIPSTVNEFKLSGKAQFIYSFSS